ncbi:MAG: hypothetical protein ACTTIC_01140 [Helicobacteraceae bacterium]
MVHSYTTQATVIFEPDLREPLTDSIFNQYERVIVESIITSFGLDFLIKDRHGGDVDTVYNVRQIGKDVQMTYKNQANAAVYEDRGEYDSRAYHSDPAYIAKNREISIKRKSGDLTDAYTGKRMSANDKSDLDHVISAKEIHNNRGRVLSGISGLDLANSDENLQATNPHTNRTKKVDSMTDFLEKHGDEYSSEQKVLMLEKDRVARRAYNQKIERAYYTSSQFRTDVALAAGSVGLKMGVRQAVGFVFTEIWFCVKDEFDTLKQRANFDLADFLRQ